MSTDAFQEIVNHLRAIRAAIAALRDEVHEIRTHQEEISRAIASLRRPAFSSEHEGAEPLPATELEARLERLADEVAFIKRRLALREL